VNKPTRRVRGNSTPPDDLPIHYWEDVDNREIEKEINDTVALLWFIIILVLATVLMMFVWGKL
jgi:hypothetical protein